MTTNKHNQADMTRYDAPRVNVRENSNEFILEAAMPGVDEKSADVTVEEGVLTLTGRTGREVPDQATLLGGEFNSEAYRRAFRLPDYVDVKGIKAEVRNGLLRVLLPKREEMKTTRITVSAA